MDVKLPDYGCNIINSSSSFYNYSNNNRTRETYYIYEGVAHKQSTSTSTTGYNVTGDCISTGDLIYKPELQIYLPLISFILICSACLIMYWCIFKRFLK